jgi:hypothetical protein
MPQRSDRALLLLSIESVAEHVAKFCSDSDEAEEQLEDLAELKLCVKRHRYIERPKKYKANVMVNDEWFQRWISDVRFVMYCKMSRRSFDFIYQCVKDHPVFQQSLLSPSCQRSSRFQLFVAISRLCQNGSAGTELRVADIFNIGNGTVQLYTDRSLEALGSLAARFILWPNASRRRMLSKIGEEEFGFPGFVLSVDGTLLVLHRAPAAHMRPETYHHPRHHQYGFNTLLFTDHLRYICSYCFGWPGQASDSTIFASTALARSPSEFLSLGEEFVFADLGFKRENYVITPFKGAAADVPHNALFNKAQRSGRCRIEHVNGQLKARFASLRAIPIDIKRKDDVHNVHHWVQACIVLHNILVYLNDEYDFPPVPPDDDLEFTLDDVNNVSGKDMQELVRDRWLREVAGWVDA